LARLDVFGPRDCRSYRSLSFQQAVEQQKDSAGAFTLHISRGITFV
jgi:hypothetical protein